MSVIQNPWEDLQKYLLEGDQISQNVDHLRDLIAQIQAALGELSTQQSALNNQLAELLKIPPDQRSDLQKQQISTLESKISANQNAIKEEQTKLQADQGQLNAAQNSLKNFIVANGTQGNANAQLTEQRRQTDVMTTKQALNERYHQTQEEQAEATRREATEAVANYSKTVIEAGEDAIKEIDRIIKDENGICDKNSTLKELQNRIIKDSVEIAACYAASGATFGASLLLAVALAIDLAKAVKERDSLEADIAGVTSDLDAAKTALENDLTLLSSANVSEIQTLIDGLFKSLEKVLAAALAGTGSSDDLKAALAMALNFLQMITTKVHQIYQEDQQWMQRGSAEGYGAATHQAQKLYESLGALQEFSHFMKAVMESVNVITGITAVGMTALSCGSMTPAAAALVVTMTAVTTMLNVSGLMNKAVESLSKAMSKNNATWAKVLANVIVTIACCVLTCSVSSAVGRFVTTVAQEAEMTVTQQVTLLLRNLLKTLISPEMWGQMLKQMGSKQGIFMATSYFSMGNGFVNLGEFVYAACRGKANESEEELAKDDKAFESLEIVFAVLQALMVAFAAYRGLSSLGESAEGEKSIAELLGKELGGRRSQILMIAQCLQGAANGASMVANTGSAINFGEQAGLQVELGDTQAKITVTQMVEEMNKMLSGKELENFAAEILEEVRALLAVLRAMSEGELEAGKVLVETAV